ncbi:hypothetical protein [Methanosarcina spelaei]|uniref:hypothetical protein n=1 Tax=Methanosarcina spelaei TaxID=1036679 RepID=UPI001FE41A88|nr:hypothetical protein [Methanosarcina spelaei]
MSKFLTTPTVPTLILYMPNCARHQLHDRQMGAMLSALIGRLSRYFMIPGLVQTFASAPFMIVLLQAFRQIRSRLLKVRCRK